MNFDYDVIIIGSGPGGYVAAIRAAQLGHKTAIIEKDNLGGICLNWGCIPTKALLKSSEIYASLKKSDYYGINADKVSFDFSKIINRSRSVAKSLSEGINFLLNKNKIDHIKGDAKFTDKNTLSINQGIKNKELKSKYILIATGARARELPNIAFSKNVWSYKEAMNPKEMPKSITIVGSGAIGIEFASFYNSLGCNVSVIEIANRILPNEDIEVSKSAQSEFEKNGIKFYLSSSIKSLTEKNNKCDLTIVSSEKNKTEIITSEKIILAVGITGNIEDLNLEKINIQTSEGHIPTNKWMQTNIENIYAIGDVTGAPWLAHKASHEGVLCIEKISGLSPEPLNKDNIPGCVYSNPQIASIGLTEKEARDNNPNKIRVGKFPLLANGKAKAIGNEVGFIKVIYDDKNGELLGAHMLGDNVTELIHGYAIAKNMEGTEEDIISTIFPHPTISESLHEAVLNAYDMSIHY